MGLISYVALNRQRSWRYRPIASDMYVTKRELAIIGPGMEGREQHASVEGENDSHYHPTVTGPSEALVTTSIHFWTTSAPVSSGKSFGDEISSSQGIARIRYIQ